MMTGNAHRIDEQERRCPLMWFKIDDGFYDHPKVFDMPDPAVALWVRAGTWAARNLTDGFIPSSLPGRLCDDPATAVHELLDRGLWLRSGGGYVFHDWLDYQPSAEETRLLRKKRSEAGRKGVLARRLRKANAQASAEQVVRDDKQANAEASDTTQASGQANPKQELSKSLKTSKTQAFAKHGAKQNPTPYPYPIDKEQTPTESGETSSPAKQEPKQVPKQVLDDNKAAQELARAYTDHVPLSKFPAVMALVKRARKTGRYSDEQIRAALVRLADEGRSPTVDALRYELEGYPQGRRRAGPDERVRKFAEQQGLLNPDDQKGGDS